MKRRMMQRLRTLFGSTPLSYSKIILFAVLIGVYTFAANMIPWFYDTSIRDISLLLEVWFVAATFIAVNCRTAKEAACKCFLFFLISQPLVYLLKAPFVGWQVFQYYRFWFLVTILTLPGGALAWRTKQGDVWSALILAVENGYLMFQGTAYLRQMLHRFPHHLLTVLFCYGSAALLTPVLLQKKKLRILSYSLTIAALLLSVVIQILFPSTSDLRSWYFRISHVIVSIVYP